MPMAVRRHKINEEILAPTLRVIDEQGQNIGVMSKEEAIAKAREAGVDLVETVATADPPIAKIISYDKFRYQNAKEEKKKREQTKTVGQLKQIQISGRAAENDLKIKAKKADEFLEEGDTVEIMLKLRGREKYNQDWSRGRLQLFLTFITVPHKITMPIRPGGRGLVMQIMKNK